MSITLRLDQPAIYEIQLFGRLEEHWTNHFDGFAISYHPFEGEAAVVQQPITTLRGVAADQSALHGMLNHIRDLGLPLLKVECISTLESISSQGE
jgi:hypothetical protein